MLTHSKREAMQSTCDCVPGTHVLRRGVERRWQPVPSIAPIALQVEKVGEFTEPHVVDIGGGEAVA